MSSKFCCYNHCTGSAKLTEHSLLCYPHIEMQKKKPYMNKLLGAALVPMEACKSEKAQQHGSVVEESKCRTFCLQSRPFTNSKHLVHHKTW